MLVHIYIGLAPRKTKGVLVELAAGSTVGEVLQSTEFSDVYPNGDKQTFRISIWGRVVAPDTVLIDKDRVELLRNLLVDPKIARRTRYLTQKDEFARRRRNTNVNTQNNTRRV